MITTGQRNLITLANGLYDRTPETKKMFAIFSPQNPETFHLNFALFSFFLNDFVNNRTRKLGVAVSIIINQNISGSFPLCWLVFLPFPFSATFPLSLSLFP